MRHAIALSVLCFLCSLLGCEARAPASLEFSGPTMGTTYSVKIARPPAGLTVATLRAEIERILAEVVATLSTYDPDSELSRLNRDSRTDWIPVSPALYAVLAEGQRLAALTGGAFDITVGPLVNLWGFGPEARRTGVPSAAEIAAARARVGWRLLELHTERAAVRKARPDLYLDLSALGEGVGVERMAAALRARGLTDYLVAVAGTLRASGRNAHGRSWTVAIEEPLPEQRVAHLLVPLAARAISTSGDYRNFFEHEGRRYAHEIDPHTGVPVARALGSVTVLGDDAMTVDGLATALMVLGETRGPALAAAEGIAAYFIVRDGARARGFGSPAWNASVGVATATAP